MSETSPTPRVPRHLAVRSDGLTVAQAAEQLGVHQQTVRNWINTWQADPATGLPVTRFGPGRGVLRIHPEDLQEYAGAQ